MIVMKFGGTSIQSKEVIQNVVEVTRKAAPKKPVLVFSALGKTTDQLLSAAESAGHGRIELALTQLAEIQKNHFEIANDLIPDFEQSECCREIRSFFQDLYKLIEGLSLLKEMSGKSQDKILSYGELISSTLLSGVLEEAGLPIKWVDARDMIVTDENYTQASPLQPDTEELIRKKLQKPLEQGELVVTQGFIASTKLGTTTTLGFEGSDYTASLIGSACGAEDVQIWKTVSGLMTTDPFMCSDAYSVPWVSYEEAGTLTFLGAKVLHQKAIYPVVDKNIPIHIFNIQKPNFEGTKVSKGTAHNRDSGGNSKYAAREVVTSITYQKNISILKLSPPSDRLYHLYMRDVLDLFNREKCQPEITTSTHGYALFVFHNANFKPSLMDYLERISASVSLEKNKATVSLVADGLYEISSLTEKAFRSLQKLPIHFTLQNLSPNQMTFVLDEPHVAEAVNELHRDLVEAK
jgi:aspartate kinase